jgi:hypothetical protein
VGRLALRVMDEQIFTPDDLAERTKLHRDTIRKMFIDEPGVLRVGHGTIRGKRQYFQLRIPESVARRVFARMTVGGRAA